MTEITDKQRRILRAINYYPVPVRHIAIVSNMTINAVQKSLRRMEDRKLVRRTPGYKTANKWELTEKGRESIA